MRVKFSKMQGLGNDFVVINAINQKLSLTPEQIKFVANRHFGVGCDQLLLLESPESENAEFKYRIFNADGNEVEQCGNGARCFARFVIDKGLTKNKRIIVETNTGKIVLQLMDDDQVLVDMGVPEFVPDKIPFIAETPASAYPIEVIDLDKQIQQLTVGAVSMGNPHTVLIVADVAHAPIEVFGPLLENHPRFPQKVNVGFMQVVDREHIMLRVFERGVGETLACGTGACAAVVVGIDQGVLNTKVEVSLPGGVLSIQWEGDGHSVKMQGPAVHVFDGELLLPNILPIVGE